MNVQEVLFIFILQDFMDTQNAEQENVYFFKVCEFLYMYMYVFLFLNINHL